MKCWKCGAELAPEAAFCNACGARQSQPQGDPNQGQGPFPGTPPTVSGGNGGGMILTAFAAVCMAVCGGLAVRALYYAIRVLFSFSGLINMIRGVGLNFLSAVMLALMAISCALIAFKRTPRNSDGLLVCLAGSGVGFLAVKFLVMIANIIMGLRYYFSGSMIAGYFGNFVEAIVGVAVAVAGVYLIERFVLGEFPLAGKSVDDLKMDVRAALDSFQQTAGQVGAQAQQAAQNAKAAQQARAAQQAQYNQQQAQYNQQQAQYNQYNNYQQNPYQQNAYGGQTPPPSQGYAPFRLKADRSLIAFILLSIITCGIYELYFIYALARDVNAACAGDGRSTAGLVKLILLGLVTCGIYTWYWYYALGNRLAANAPRYGLNFQENGTTVLLWMLLGSLLCGLGVFVGWHILIKNANSICGAYNYQHGI